MGSLWKNILMLSGCRGLIRYKILWLPIHVFPSAKEPSEVSPPRLEVEPGIPGLAPSGLSLRHPWPEAAGNARRGRG